LATSFAGIACDAVSVNRVRGNPVTDPTVTDPTVTDPAVTDPAVTDPAVTDPAVTGPHVIVSGPDPQLPPPPPEPLPGARLFVEDQVLEIHLTLAPTDQESLAQNGDEEIYVPAQASIAGAGIEQVQLDSIGMRHKGAYTLHHCWDEAGVRSYEDECAKLSYKLKFDEYAPDSRLDGLKRLNLHAASGDDTRMRELVAYSTFREFGVDAPRTAIAKVYVNGDLEGLFIAVEALDGRYTKAHFSEGGGDGNLYKEVWPRSGLDSAKLVESLRTNEDVGDVSAFISFGNAVSASTSATFAANMAQWVDLEHALRYVAVDRALKNWDGIMAFYSPRAPHNFYWYHDVGGSGRFRLVPWDMDNASWDFDPYMDPQAWVTAAPVPDWNEEPSGCSPRSVWDTSGNLSVTPPRCDRFLDLLAETQFDRFQSAAAELLAGPFDPDRLVAKVTHLSALLEPIIAEDPYLDLADWRSDRDDFKLLLRRASADLSDFAAGGLRSEGDPAP
jgi:hypothetical protein